MSLVQDIQKEIREEGILGIDLKFIDLNGAVRRVTISKDQFNEKLMSNGIGFDGSSVTGFRKVSAGDLVLIPDLTTKHYEPFSDEKVMSFLCNIKEADTREQFADDPRYIAQKAVDYLKTLDVADEALFAPEYEFFMFSKVSFDSDSNFSFYHIDSEEGYWNNESNKDEVSYLPMKHQQGYHRSFPNDRFFQVRQDIVKEMEKFNIPFKYHHHEVGGPSQHEIEVPLMPIFKACDSTTWVKYITKNIARYYGQFATFMPKPMAKDAGSGMHNHITLMKNGKNIFFGNNYANLSDEALYFIGGILKHGKSLAALTNPSINSYKRLVPGFEAPTNLFFSLGNRSAAIRIPKYATNENDIRIEFRTSDATCNHYFALPAILMAGLDGIKNKIDPQKEGFGPIDEDIHEMPAEEVAKIDQVPASLEKALKELEKDHDYLLAGNVFSKEFVESWIHAKNKEVQQMYHSIDPTEYKLYFDI